MIQAKSNYNRAYSADCKNLNIIFMVSWRKEDIREDKWALMQVLTATRAT
jgi:hypothetical protein